MPASRRTSYTNSAKLMMIEYAEKHGNRAAEREYGVSESCIRTWRKVKEKLLSAPSEMCASGRGSVAHHPDLEMKISEWLADQQLLGIEVSIAEIRRTALKFAHDMNIGKDVFKASQGWCRRFRNRYMFPIKHRKHAVKNLSQVQNHILPDSFETVEEIRWDMFTLQEGDADLDFETSTGDLPEPLVVQSQCFFQCLNCSLEFEEETDRDRHMVFHTTHRKFRCSKCQKLYQLKENSDPDVQQMADWHDICDDCNNVFINKEDMQQHMLNHEGEYAQYACNLCDEFFLTLTQLRKHQTGDHDKADFRFRTCVMCYKKSQGLPPTKKKKVPTATLR